MRISVIASLLAFTALTAACAPSSGPVMDPQPAATYGEAITEPTDGAQNEISVDG